MRTLVLGSMNIDRVYRVRNFVRPKETIHVESFDCVCGGKGFNQAVALARAGSKVSFAGVVGADGGAFLKLFEQDNIDTALIKQSRNANGHTIIQVSDAGENCIMVASGANAETSREYIQSVLAQINPGDWLLLQNEIANVDYAIKSAHERGVRVALNPSPFESAILEYGLDVVDLLLVNEVEGEELTGVTMPDQILASLHETYPQMSVLLTLGAEGAVFMGSNGTRHSVPSVPCVVRDTTAAGDTFTGYFLTEYLSNGDITAALTFAATASSIAVSRNGAADSIPVRSEVIEHRTRPNRKN